MTETLETLSKRIATARDLDSIVRTMKSLSAVSIRQYESAVAALREFNRTVELGLQAALGRHAFSRPEAVSRDIGTAAVIFGSDHGLCGRFNESITEFALGKLEELEIPSDERTSLVLGLRAAAHLEWHGVEVDDCRMLPGAVTGLTAMVHGILMTLDEWRRAGSIARILLFHNRRAPETNARPHMLQLLPIDEMWLREFSARRWPSRTIPMFTMERDTLISALLRQHLFVAIYRAAAESQASEHAVRLATMQAAENNIEERMEEMIAEFRRVRQDTITAELMDIVAGAEALRTVSDTDRSGAT